MNNKKILFILSLAALIGIFSVLVKTFGEEKSFDRKKGADAEYTAQDPLRGEKCGSVTIELPNGEKFEGGLYPDVYPASRMHPNGQTIVRIIIPGYNASPWIAADTSDQDGEFGVKVKTACIKK